MKKADTLIDKLLIDLKNEKVNTWFDLGLFLDRIKENRKVPQNKFRGSYEDFKSYIRKGEIGFFTYQFSVDGVTIEIVKYTKILRQKYK